jgi:hypothetical protein
MIHGMHAGGGEGAARRFLRRGAPIVRRDELRGAGGVLRHQGDDIPESPVFETVPDLHNRGMEPPAIADGEGDASLARSGDRGVGARALERDRLLHVDVLAGGGSLQHLLLVLAMRRRQHDSIHVPIGENLLVAVDERNALLAAEVLRARARAGMGGDEADVVALALHCGDERAPPAPQSDDGCADHHWSLFGMIGSRMYGARSASKCNVFVPPKISGGRSRGSVWVKGPTPFMG